MRFAPGAAWEAIQMKATVTDVSDDGALVDLAVDCGGFTIPVYGVKRLRRPTDTDLCGYWPVQEEDDATTAA